MALTELGQYLFISSLMAISFLCSFGPVWYQPTILSLAEQKREGFPVRPRGEAPAGGFGQGWSQQTEGKIGWCRNKGEVGERNYKAGDKDALPIVLTHRGSLITYVTLLLGS